MAATTETSARRWSGYVCPDCRFVFRVPRDHDGTGLVCPSCRRLLKLPVSGEPLPPLVSEIPREGSVPLPEPGRRRKKASREPEWEHTANPSGSRRSDQRFYWGVGTLFSLLSAGVVFLLIPKAQDPPPLAPVASLPTATPPQETAPAAIVPAGPDFNAFNSVAEPMAKSFLTATEVSAILPLVRNPHNAEPRLKTLWPDGHIKPDGVDAIAGDAAFSVDGTIGSLSVRTGDFNYRRMFFVKTPEGWKIDWESWVAWCDMPWEDFLTNRPASPLVFRATVQPASYYNFDFSDEDKWRSFHVKSVDGSHSVYGYAPRGSELEKNLSSPDNPAGDYAVIVKLHFLPNTRHDQVVIDQLVAPGWVEPEPGDKP